MTRWAARFPLALACALLACARQAPPPGGPEDRTPPKVQEVSPAPGQAGVPLGQPVRIVFSKSMNRTEVEAALRFFPPPPSPPEFKWEGHALVILPDTAWEIAQTYVMTLPPEATDTRGNRLPATWQSAFSTGERIDSGRITGQVLAQARPAPRSWVLCYRGTESGSDPEKDTADYVVQADEEGRFALSFLGTGSYRVFALEDRDRDWLWNRGVEPLAVPAFDIHVNPTEQTGALPALHLSPFDTTLPLLLDCSWRAPGWWELEFDTDWPAGQIDSIDVLFVRGSDTSRSDRVLRVPIPGRGLLARDVSQAAGVPAEIGVRHVRAGSAPGACVPLAIPGDTAAAFEPVVQPDTGRPWTCSPAQISLWFTERIASVDSAAIRLGGKPVLAAVPVPFQLALAWDGDSDIQVPPLHIAPGAVRSTRGNAWPPVDTVRLHFPLPLRDSTGRYEIRIHGLPAAGAAFWALKIWPAGYPDRVCVVPARADSVVSGQLAAGNYLLSLLHDLDGDGEWSSGWPFPFSPSERTLHVTDTLRVRARFTTEFTLQLLK